MGDEQLSPALKYEYRFLKQQVDRLQDELGRKDRPRKYFCWRIQMEIVMTHKPTIQWCADRFGGKVYEKPRGEHKMQYRWRRSFRDALEIAKAIIPYSVTKKEKLQQVIDHYGDKT